MRVLDHGHNYLLALLPQKTFNTKLDLKRFDICDMWIHFCFFFDQIPGIKDKRRPSNTSVASLHEEIMYRGQNMCKSMMYM